MTGTPALEQHPSNPFVDGVVRRSDMVAAGHSNYSLATRCRPGGPWQPILPGILLLANSPPNRRQRLKAAVLYARNEAVITGSEALREHDLILTDTTEVSILIPDNRRLSARGYVRVERTSRMPKPVILNGLPFAPPHRAAVDAARHSRDPTDQRMLLFSPVHAGLCSLDDIRTELKACSQRGTAALRPLLDESATPVLTSTVHQGWAKRVINQAPVPNPEWNVPVYNGSGKPLGVADAWWDEVALAWDFDNQRDDGADRREERFTKAGLVLVRTSLPELRGNPEDVVRELTLGFLHAASRPRPKVQAHR
ncbi:hypothetical protein JOF56_000944 [Kibdelosporangium banguiense]|uniref:DUF559 domain-containing protein n=1 Tax=Kibdelosporangium banguiense TaxID=1365924 RepID=A0ABS4T9E8_9PSEU|nr:hypothetical protein [Kibdelosporangium banguiense]MBP2320559.1 hypothetical protein [Kibdelosporangium banguiense]